MYFYDDKNNIGLDFFVSKEAMDVGKK